MHKRILFKAGELICTKKLIMENTKKYRILEVFSEDFAKEDIFVKKLAA